jgi:hypothetical protein
VFLFCKTSWSRSESQNISATHLIRIQKPCKAPCLGNKNFKKLKKFERLKSNCYLPMQEVDFLFHTSSLEKEKHDQLNLSPVITAAILKKKVM